ncbi:uncharacterized protein LOC122349325 [Puntigrus tetrazona]|uniref:uncharacterized protein LOC122349325 n=1 Tax=Puntigrus tetrazona TaxID=1606681 RepID=UPI001C88F83E|nr:uncharacterized protein LOC122349325 [Puntigrus tetrazona]
MSCTYTYPPGYKIEKAFWFKNPVKDVEPPDLSKDPEYSQRFQYLGDKQKSCTMRLSHVTQKDEHKYYFRFITDKPDGKWTGEPGVTLTVTDLQVESPERVTEGDSVRLTCKSSCALTDRATFIWYRNSQPLTERRDRNNILLLQSVRREDAGRYSCDVQEHNHYLRSPEVYLNVTYPSKNVSMFINGSGEAVSVTVKEHLVILYISIGAVCGAAVIIITVLIWIRMKKRKGTLKTQDSSMMDPSRNDYNSYTASEVESSEPVYANVTNALDACNIEMNEPAYGNIMRDRL